MGKTTVVVTYDGATDCDEDSTAHWSLNGQDQGRAGEDRLPRRRRGLGLAWGALGALLLRRPRCATGAGRRSRVERTCCLKSAVFYLYSK
ncbi:MAG TPA: hypothetical protein VNA24_19560 [Hyalangium sp.]|nr:hypothetical protein [Hyalangium sp.]